MKKSLLTSMALLCVVALFAQQPVKQSSSFAKSYSVERAVKHTPVHYSEMAPAKASSVVMGGDVIGQTYYDNQTNATMQNKLVAHADGSISACWTTAGTSAASRGTGYNYYNGTEWTLGVSSTSPYNRIEDSRTGWGVMAAVGNGEIVVSHNGTDALVIGLRPQKGTGDWTFSTLAGPAASNGSGTSTCLLWPAIATNGNTIHLLACTESDEGYLYQGIHVCLLYIRGTYDQASNTVTWESPRVVGNVTSATHARFSGDEYAIDARGNNVAILVADMYNDVIIWKSADNGVNFTTTTVFNNPVPDAYDEATDIIDTTGGNAVYTPDGSCAIAIGADGICHVAFGIMRWANPEAGDGSYTWWPYTDGLLYWNENMTPILSGDNDALDPETLIENGYQVYQRIDLDGDGSVWYSQSLNMTENYRVTMTSTPQLTVDGNNVYLIFTTFLDLPFIDQVNSMYYRGVFGTKSVDNGATWNDDFSWLSYNNRCYYLEDWSSYDTTQENMWNNLELVISEGESMYPAMAKNVVNGKLNIYWQQDYFADNNGGSISSDPSNIFFMQLDANQLGVYNNTKEIPQGLWVDTWAIADNTLEGMKLYPNPASQNVNIAFSSTEMAEGMLTVYNLMGQVIYSESIAIAEGANLVNVNTNAFSAGVYTVNIKTNKGTSTQKLIVR